MSKPNKSSLYFRHCDKPTLEPIEGTAKGSIPTWVEGTLTRNGPGIQKVGSDEYKHAFDGLAVLHRIHIAGGKATYSHRPLESDTYRQNMEAQRIVVSEFGTQAIPDACSKIFSSLKTEYEEGKEKPSLPLRDNCSVNVGYYGDQLYAMTETYHVRRIHPETLLPVGDKTVISDYLAINSATAHPHVLENGNVINMGNHFTHAKGPHYAFFEVPPKFNTLESSFTDAKKIAEIPATTRPTPSYFHSFGLTKDKIIFIEAPLRLHLSEMMTKEGKRNGTVPKDAYHWQSGQKTRFHVVSIGNGTNHPIVYETDKLFTFHHINAYEEDGQLVVDVAGYDSGAFICENMEKNTIDKVWNSGGSGRRYVLPLTIPKGNSGNLVTLKDSKATATVRAGNDAIVDVKPEMFIDEWFEFPRINYKFNGLKYRYIYGVTSSVGRGQNQALPEADTLVKIDVENGKILTWKEKNVITPEPVFVANPNAGAEDDGVIITPLLHTDDLKKTTLLVLNAKNFEELARVVFHADGNLPSTFHGQWANKRDQIHHY